MNVKRKLLGTAVVATMALSGTAGAVHLSETGTGEVLLFPYYTTRSVDGNAFDTYINITNTTGYPKAVKVRFREAKNSREVLDFNLYLSPYDVWVASVSDTGSGAKVVPFDNSCTVPIISASGEPFRSSGYTGSSADGAGSTLDRTREGYIEVIEMGVPRSVNIAPSGSTVYFDEAIEHNASGVPANCRAVERAWERSANRTNSIFDGIEDGNGSLDVNVGGLMGFSTIINPKNGTAVTNEPTVLDDWSDKEETTRGVHSYPGTEAPKLGDAAPISHVFYQNDVVASTWARDIDAVSAVMMRNAVMNSYTTNPDVAAKTDWIVTFPTKKDYVTTVVTQNNAATAPFTKNFVSTGGEGACEAVEIGYWSREEQTPGGGVDFSPSTPGEGSSLCWEANVLTFKPQGVTGYTGVFGSKIQVDVPVAYNTGWARIDFVDTNAAVPGVEETGVGMVDTAGNTYFGLPVIGFAAISRTNGAVSDGVLANYGNATVHKYERSITLGD